MKRIKNLALAVALLAGLMLPTVRKADEPTKAELPISPAAFWIFEAPNCSGECGGG